MDLVAGGKFDHDQSPCDPESEFPDCHWLIVGGPRAYEEYASLGMGDSGAIDCHTRFKSALFEPGGGHFIVDDDAGLYLSMFRASAEEPDLKKKPKPVSMTPKIPKIKTLMIPTCREDCVF